MWNTSQRARGNIDAWYNSVVNKPVNDTGDITVVHVPKMPNVHMRYIPTMEKACDTECTQCTITSEKGIHVEAI